MQYQSDSAAAEEFKIASFVSMVDGCSVVGVPYSPVHAGRLSLASIVCFWRHCSDWISFIVNVKIFIADRISAAGNQLPLSIRLSVCLFPLYL